MSGHTVPLKPRRTALSSTEDESVMQPLQVDSSGTSVSDSDVSRKWRLRWLLIAVFFDLLGVAFVVPLFPQFAKRLNMDARQMGYMGSLYGVTQLLGAPFMGRISDGFGRRPVLLLSCAGAAVSYVGTGVATSVWMMYACRLLIGFCKQTTSAAQAYIADVSSVEERNVVLGRMGGSIGLAFIVGPALGGFLSTRSLQMPVAASFACFVIEFVIIICCLPESAKKLSLATPASSETPVADAAPSPMQRSSSDIELQGMYRSRNACVLCRAVVTTLRREFRNLLRYFKDEDLRYIFSIIFVTHIGLQTYQSSILVGLQDRFQLGPQDNGNIWAYLGLLGALVQFLGIRPLTKRYSDNELTIYCVLCTGLSHFALALAPSMLVWMAVHPMVSLGEGTLRTTLVGAASKAVPTEKMGVTLGAIGSLQSICRIIGPMLGGELMSRYGVRAPSLFCSAMLMAVGIFLAVSRGVYSHVAAAGTRAAMLGRKKMVT